MYTATTGLLKKELWKVQEKLRYVEEERDPDRVNKEEERDTYRVNKEEEDNPYRVTNKERVNPYKDNIQQEQININRKIFSQNKRQPWYEKRQTHKRIKKKEWHQYHASPRCNMIPTPLHWRKLRMGRRWRWQQWLRGRKRKTRMSALNQ